MGFNAGVVEAPNQVTVIEKLGEPTSSTKSKLAAKLGIGQAFDIELSENLSVRVQFDSLLDPSTRTDAVINLSVVGDILECPGGYNAEVTVELTTDNYPAET